MKISLLYISIILFINISFLFSPKPIDGKGNWCIEYISINRYMGIAINCDSYDFLNASIKPKLLLESNFKRQSRPLYTLAGTAIGYSIYAISSPIHNNLYKSLQKNFSKKYTPKQLKKATLYGCHYIGYILLNALISMVTALILHKSLLRLSRQREIPILIISAFLIFLNSNIISKAFFWTSHQQLFNILCPVTCIYIILIRKVICNSAYRLLFLSFVCGLLVLLYGIFLLLLPTIIYCCIIQWKPISGVNLRTSLLYVSLATVIFLFPTIVWIMILKFNEVTFYSYEVREYRQFIWIWDTLNVSTKEFSQTVFINLIEFIKTFKPMIVYICFLLPPFIITKAYNRIYTLNFDSIKRQLFTFTFLIFFLFFWMMGFYEERLTFSFAPLILLFIGTLSLYKYERKSITIESIWLLSALAWHFFNVISYGPFS